MISILLNWTRHVTEARSISPSRVPSRLSAAGIDNRESCCVTPGCGSSSITTVESEVEKNSMPANNRSDEYIPITAFSQPSQLGSVSSSLRLPATPTEHSPHHCHAPNGLCTGKNYRNYSDRLTFAPLPERLGRVWRRLFPLNL